MSPGKPLLPHNASSRMVSAVRTGRCRHRRSLKNTPQTGQASRRHRQNFLVLCDMAQGYTQSHSDKPNCVHNDYSPAITLTPHHPTSVWQLPYTVAPVQGSYLMEPFGGNTEQAAVVVSSLCNRVWQLNSRGTGPHFLIISSFLGMAVVRSHRVKQFMTRHVPEKKAFTFKLGSITKKLELRMPVRSSFIKLSGQVTQQVRAHVV